MVITIIIFFLKIIKINHLCVDDDIILSSRVFRWPQEIEQFLDLATSRVIQKKGVVEGQLKTKKTEFEFEYAIE